MEPMELLQWVVLGLILPWLGWIAHVQTKIRSQLASIGASLEEMHKYHAPQLNKAIDILITEIRGLRADFKDVIPRLSEEHRAQDAALLALKEQVAELKVK